MKLKKPLDMVISDCDASISLDKTWWRAFQRKAEALAEHGRYQDAESVVTAALRINPDQHHFRKRWIKFEANCVCRGTYKRNSVPVYQIFKR
jgi:hypothetical protein